MSNDNPDTERRPRPGGETRIEEKRSLTHAAATAFVVATATGAGLKTGTGIADGVKQTVAKGKDALKPKESKVELPPGVDSPD